MNEQPTRGSLLIASPQLLDSNFRRSVVILCDHDDHGSLGLVMNRPMQVPLGKVVPALADHEAADALVYQGGPVEQSRLLAVRRWTHPDEHLQPVGGGLYLVADLQHTIDRLVDGTVRAQDYRFFLGYSGWGQEQLRGELRERAWILSSAEVRLAFDIPTPHIWSESLRQLGGKYALYAQMPIDPELN